MLFTENGEDEVMCKRYSRMRQMGGSIPRWVIPLNVNVLK